jgi:hypothetical protein
MTPTISRGTLLTTSVRPMTSFAAAKRLRHSDSPRITAFGPPGLSSSAVNERPRIGATCSIGIIDAVTQVAVTRSGATPSPSVQRLALPVR